MGVKSYIVHNYKGKKEMVFQSLNQLKGCSVTKSENKDILVLVTETNSKVEEENLKVQIGKINGLKHLAMVAGFNDQIN